MGKKIVKNYSRFIGGISDSSQEGPPDSHVFSQAVDFRSDPQNVTLLPKAIKESGNVITDLPKWGEVYNANLTAYIYGNTGNLYARTSAGSHTFLRQVQNSHGNGEVYSAEDDFLYYASDKVVGRYGPLASSTPTFTDDFFGSQGGVPLNTNSLQLLSASSQYADRADTASLSITGNLAIRAQIDPTTLPSSGNSMTIASKWNPNGNLRSYLLDMAAVSGYFGDGSDGALTISSNTTYDTTNYLKEATCTGTSGATSLSYASQAGPAAFVANEIILIHQSQGTGAGTWQRNKILSVTGTTSGTITLETALNATYISGAQVLVLKQWSSVTVNTGITLSAKGWNGSSLKGGILAFLCNGTTTITGSINAAGQPGDINPPGNAGGHGLGFNGGPVPLSPQNGWSGAGTTGAEVQQATANGNGAGGVSNGNTGSGSGGGNGTAGNPSTGNGAVGSTSGSADLTTMTYGGGGGSTSYALGNTGGGAGGAIIFISAQTLTVTGSITANGGAGGTDNRGGYATGGGGAGGSILLKAITATLGTALITATGGLGGTTTGTRGGSGGDGRIHIDYYTSYTGTSSPTLNATQDNTLSVNTAYQLRLSLSSNGTNSETLTQTFVPQTGIWQQVGVSWVASTSTATFYLNAVSLGTRVGAFTAIADTTARFAVGANFDSGGLATNFYNGFIDEVQVYNMVQSQTQFFAAINSQISTTEAGLQAYYKFNNAATDATSNANDLTLQNAPTYSTNVPFPSATTRLDIDQSATTAGNTYTTLTAISEGGSDRLTFTPNKDPQKSMAVLVAAKGTGAWTITIHDSLNNSIATSTITNANMTTGYVEFTFSSLWRPLTNFTNTYHAHITSTVADGTITSTTAGNCETISYRTYYQFLVTDTAWHPMTRLLNFWVVGNERWVGKYEATLYEPNKIAVGADWKVRCFGKYLEYLVIGVAKNTTNIYDADVGRLYFWDGFSPTYNFPIEVPEGGVNAILGVGAKLYIWAGYKNQLLEYAGGYLTSDVQKIKFLPKMETTTYSETYPQAVTMWQSLLRWGATGSSNSTTLNRSVYTYGKSSIRYEDSLSSDYVISTGNTGSTVSIGLTMVVNRKLLIGWQDGTAFGMDYVDTTTTNFGLGKIELLLEDEGTAWKAKDALNLKAVFAPIVAGDSFSLRYKVNNQSAWSASTTTTTVGDTSLVLSIPSSRYYQFQVGCDFSTTNTTSPQLQGLGFELDTLDTEKGIGTINES